MKSYLFDLAKDAANAAYKTTNETIPISITV